MTAATPGQAHTEAERLRSAEITLATIRHHAEETVALTKAVGGVGNRAPHAQGYHRAMRSVLAILDARWLPEGTPVVLNPEDDE